MACDHELSEVGNYSGNEEVKARRDQRHAANRVDREERKNKVLYSKVYVMIFFMINILSFFKLRSSYHQLKLTIFLINTADRVPPGKGPLLQARQKARQSVILVPQKLAM